MRKILVFESDEFGAHDSVVSRIAMYKYGAKWGIGHGLTGDSYAIPTKDMFNDKLSIDEIKSYVKKFIDFAKKNDKHLFLLTKIGTFMYGLDNKGFMDLLPPGPLPHNVDIVELVNSDFISTKRYATFFGGAIDDKTTLEYLDSIKIGSFLAEKGYVVKSGGYKGLMEGVSKGAYENKGYTLGFTCKTFKGSKPNDYITQEITNKDIYDRLRGLIENSNIYIFGTGGVGTLSEFFLTIDTLRKCKNLSYIFIIGDMWDNIIKTVEYLIPKKIIIYKCKNFEDFKFNFENSYEKVLKK